ncbi:unnamed protein product [Rotaria sordida]|uniref:Uncharacterized protein n=2 Tax=Rotaria sordida TaxID=392033 RepID=A0A819QLQ3_9BILA|nr:unnamed protein product [Rotaria sordida]CAF4027561.1 unnamed protein product [Rotaria sordida]CAF4174207.1 unnamed protein product [Rotaria sordida]
MPYSSSFPSVTTIFHSLRHLSLNDSQWTSDTVVFLIKNTPNLHSLHIRPYGNFSQVLWTTKVYITHIRKLDILLNNDTADLASLLALFPGIRRLRVAYYTIESAPALDGKAWQKVIEDYLPCLQQMILCFCDEDENSIDEQFISTFYTGDFWSKKQMITEITMDQAIIKIKL